MWQSPTYMCKLTTVSSEPSKSDVQDYILAKNQIGWVATGASLAASYLSAFGIALPVQTMISGVVMFAASTVSMFLAIVVINKYVIPILRDNNLPSVFTLVKHKYGDDNLKLALMFSLPVRLVVGGCQMYAPALAVQTVTGFDLTTIIIVTNILVLGYTFIGGYRTVVITDIVQLVIMAFGTSVAAGLVLHGKYLNASFSEIWNFAASKDRVNPLGKLTFSPYPQEAGFWLYTPLFVTCFNRFACTQDMVQRLVAVKGGKSGAAKSLWLMCGMTVVQSLVNYLIIGLATFFVVKGCAWNETVDVETRIDKDAIVPLITTRIFKLAENDLFGFPLIGLYTASLYSASCSSISSLLNSMAMLAITDILPAIGIKLDSDNRKLAWSRISVIVTSIIVTITTIFVAWLGKIGINSYLVLVIFSAMSAPFNVVTLLATVPWFGGHGRKSIKIGIICGLFTSIFFLVMAGVVDPIPQNLKKIVNQELPLVEDCSLHRNESLVDMFRLPEQSFGSEKQVEVEIEWSFLRRIYWVSKFVIPMIVGFATLMGTKITHWIIGAENDEIGQVPKLANVI